MKKLTIEQLKEGVGKQIDYAKKRNKIAYWYNWGDCTMVKASVDSIPANGEWCLVLYRPIDVDIVHPTCINLSNGEPFLYDETRMTMRIDAPLVEQFIEQFIEQHEESLAEA